MTTRIWLVKRRRDRVLGCGKALVSICAMVASLMMAGCDGADPGNATAPPNAPESGDEDHKGHGPGPHGGHVIELGRNHEYHAELARDEDSGTVSVYIMDGGMKELAVAQTSISLSLTAGGESVSAELKGRADKNSQFVSTDESLSKTLEHHGDLKGKIRLTIDGVQYVGNIDAHSHGSHDHAH